MTVRNRKLLDIAHSAPCQAQFPHNCTGWQGCEPAHSDSQTFGRGCGHKSNDWAVAFICHNAHEMLGTRINPVFDREQKQAEWLRAYVATQNYLWTNGKVKVA